MPRHDRILYASGPGNLAESFRRWQDRAPVTVEVSETYSGQFFDYCREVGARVLAISSHHSEAELRVGKFRIEHRPKPLRRLARGPGYHLAQVLYGVSIVLSALRMRAGVVVVHSDVTYPFVLAPLWILRRRVVLVLHNALWPSGFDAKRGRVQRVLLGLNGWFWRRGVAATICVSPECERQVRSIAGTCRGPILQMRAMYAKGPLAKTPAAVHPKEGPLHVLFAGRVEPAKGAFDVLEMAETLERELPGRFRWQMCGSGSALEAVKEDLVRRGLEGIVSVRGQLKLPEMLGAYAWSHVVVVPTRSGFSEGLCRVAAEGVIAGRPVVTSRLSHALDVVGEGAVEAQPNDPASYVAALRRLALEPEFYEQKRAACGVASGPFQDRGNSFVAALRRALGLPTALEITGATTELAGGAELGAGGGQVAGTGAAGAGAAGAAGAELVGAEVAGTGSGGARPGSLGGR